MLSGFTQEPGRLTLATLDPAVEDAASIEGLGTAWTPFPRVSAMTLTLVLSTLLLSSCMIPETFTATLNINKDYGYTFEYDGIVAFGPALGEIAKEGSLPKDAEDDLRRGTADTFKKEDGFDRASYLGNARWRVHYRTAGIVGDKTPLFGDDEPLVTLRRFSDGTVTVEGMSFDAEATQQLNEVRFVIDGTLEVTTDLSVTRHNATGTPMLRGLVGHYSWRISSKKLTSPVMTLKPIGAIGTTTTGGAGAGTTLTPLNLLAPLRVGGAIRPPTQLVKVPPVYPAEARDAGVQGVVIIEAVIGKDGTVADVRVLRSIPLLDQAALDCVRQWKYSVTTVNGEPVSIVKTVTVNFLRQ